MTKIFAEGNAFSNKNREGFISAMGQIYAILARLSSNQNKELVTVTATAVYTENGETRNVSMTSFTSSLTNKTVIFFIIEGTM